MESQGWGRFEILVIAGFIVVVALVLRYAYRWSQQRAAFVAKLAAAQGWAYSRTGDSDLKNRLEALFPTEQFNPANVATVRSDGRTTPILFECTYRARGGRNPGLGAGALVASGAIGPDDPVVEIVASTPLNELLSGKKIDLGDATFGHHYFVQSADPDAARRLVGSGLRSILIRHAAAGRWPRARINLGQGHVALLIGAMENQRAWLDVLNFMRDIESALDENAR